MGTYKIAHLREQGQDMIIIPLESSYGHKSRMDQNQIQQALQACAGSAGLAGTVVPVWDAGGGRFAFLAPSSWQSFFSSISLRFVFSNINKELRCG